MADEEPAERLPASSTVAAALQELELDEAVAREGRSAPSVLAVTEATRAVEDVLAGLLAGA
jgi:hypothetical protein